MEGSGASTANPLAVPPSAPGAVFESESAPSAADVEMGPTTAELEAHYLETGVLLPEQIVQMFRAQRIENDAQIAELKDRPNAEAVFKHRSEAPTNLHQATVFLAASQDPADAAWARLLFGGGWLMVFMQVGVVVGIFTRAFHQPSCNNQQCDAGYFCNGGHCDFCGTGILLAMATAGDATAISVLPSCTCIGDDEYDGDCYRTVKDPPCAYNRRGDPNTIGFNKTALGLMCADPTAHRNVLLSQLRVILAEATREGEPLNLNSIGHVASWCDSW